MKNRTEEDLQRNNDTVVKNLKNINTNIFAYIGDSVYEVYVRKHVFEKERQDVNKLNRLAIKYARAEGQAYAVKKLTDDFLTEEEQSVVRRARNRRITSKPQNADPVVYKHATAFEALIGYLYMANRDERLDEVLKRAIELIDNADINNDRNTSKKILKQRGKTEV